MNKYGYGYAETLKRSDPRKELYKQQRAFRGFDDSELWSLDQTTLKFFVPRFKAFRKSERMGYPAHFSKLGDDLAPKVWERILLRIEKSLDWYSDEDNFCEQMPKNIELGFGLLIKYFPSLWD